MQTIDPRTKGYIADRVATEIAGFSWAMEAYELEVEDIEEIMIEHGYNKCAGCDNWFPEDELTFAPDESGDLCEDCS